jgi:Zn-dependent protease with chaperone function
MTRDEFEALVKSLEAARNKRPKVFLWNTVFLVAGAYAYLLLALLLSIGLLGLFIALIVFKPNAATIKLGIIAICLFGGLALAIVKGLWVRLQPPEGMRLRPDDAPALFAVLEELRQKLDCAPFHEVLLVPEHNAAVVQVPRLGIFGWHKNYLLIGLPLLQGLSVEEFKAVLAHEFAHSSRGHGRFGNWLYRLRLSWERIVHEVANQQNSGSIVLTAFLKFFWPRFNGRAFVLSRANEYEADDAARRLTSAEHAANALLRVSVNDRFLDEKFWPRLYETANTQPLPPGNVFGAAAMGLRGSTQEQESSKWVQQAFLLETNTADTHPALKDRLKALGVGELRAEDLPTVEQCAGEALFGKRLADFTEQLSAKWTEQVNEVWKNRHHEAAKLTKELEKLQCEEGDAAGLWKKALAVLELKGDDGAAEFVDKVLAADPNHVEATFVKGRRLLTKDDASGLNLVERALREDVLLTRAGCEILYGYYKRTGQRSELKRIEERFESFQQMEAQAQHERATVTAQDSFMAAELEEVNIALLRTIMEKEPDIESAAVVKKMVHVFPKHPCYIVALKIKVPIWKPRSSEANQKVVNRVVEQTQLPGPFLVFIVEKELASAGKKVFAVPGSEFYTRAE